MERLLIPALMLALAAVYGWIANLVTLFHSDFSHVTGVLVIRVIGVFIPVIGAVLGYC